MKVFPPFVSKICIVWWAHSSWKKKRRETSLEVEDDDIIVIACEADRNRKGILYISSLEDDESYYLRVKGTEKECTSIPRLFPLGNMGVLWCKVNECEKKELSSYIFGHICVFLRSLVVVLEYWYR